MDDPPAIRLPHDHVRPPSAGDEATALDGAARCEAVAADRPYRSGSDPSELFDPVALVASRRPGPLEGSADLVGSLEASVRDEVGGLSVGSPLDRRQRITKPDRRVPPGSTSWRGYLIAGGSPRGPPSRSCRPAGPILAASAHPVSSFGAFRQTSPAQSGIARSSASSRAARRFPREARGQRPWLS